MTSEREGAGERLVTTERERERGGGGEIGDLREGERSLTGVKSKRSFFAFSKQCEWEYD